MPTYSDRPARACIAFSTPGLIPLEAFTAFGVHAKPESVNPFGIFGTGLKYAIAVCLREGCEIVLWRGKERYTFYTKKEDFRGKTLDYVRMKKDFKTVLGWFRPTYSKLPFTLELGKGWELWQAFRELEANTRDENGKTQLEYWQADSEHAHPERTTILVFGDRFIDEWHERGRTFLPDGKVVREDDAIQVLDRPSKHIYYRGVRIMDLKKESEFTYNFLKSVDLTEDRTAKYPFMIEMELAQYIAEHGDESFVDRVLRAPSHTYEASINYGYYGGTPGRVFAARAERSTNPTARELWNRQDPTVPPTVKIIITIPRPEVTEDELAEIQTTIAEILQLGVDEIEAENMSEKEAA